MRKNALLLITLLLLAAVLILSGCTETNGGSTTTVAVNCDSMTTKLYDDSQISDNINVDSYSKFYSIYVPSGTSSLTVVLDNLQADFDLYIGFDSLDNLQGENYDWRSNNEGTSADSITVNNPQAGCYYIQITDYYNEGGSFSLVANV